MEHSELVQNTNSLKTELKCSKKALGMLCHTPDIYHAVDSKEYVIFGLLSVQLRLEFIKISKRLTCSVLIKLNELNKFDDSTVGIYFSSKKLDIDRTLFLVDGDRWRQIGVVVGFKGFEYSAYCWLDVSFQLHTEHNSPNFACLHTDRELTDFQLRGVNGSVYVHKAVLAGCSPILKQMLSEQFLQVQGATQETLQKLKDFIYLHVLSEANMEEVVPIASSYMIKGLELQCFANLMGKFTAEHFPQLIEFAMKYKMKKLLLVVLTSMQRAATIKCITDTEDDNEDMDL